MNARLSLGHSPVRLHHSSSRELEAIHVATHPGDAGEKRRRTWDKEREFIVAFTFELGKLNELLEEVRVDAETKVIGIPENELKQYENREDFGRRRGGDSSQHSTRFPSTSWQPSSTRCCSPSA